MRRDPSGPAPHLVDIHSSVNNLFQRLLLIHVLLPLTAAQLCRRFYPDCLCSDHADTTEAPKSPAYRKNSSLGRTARGPCSPGPRPINAGLERVRSSHPNENTYNNVLYIQLLS